MTIAGFRPALILTGFYLAGPLLIASELLKPAFSIPLLLLFAAWFWTLAMAAPSTSESLCRDAVFETEHAVSNGGSILDRSGSLIVCLLFCLIWVYLSGIGGFAHCRGDYIKHNLIFSYLIEGRLPIEVPFKGGGVLLHYGFAYYITPVRITEFVQPIMNIKLNWILYAVYSGILLLSLILLADFHGIFVLWLGLSLALIGGLDVLGMLVFGSNAQHVTTIPYLDIDILECLEWWGTPYAPLSLTRVLFNAPQHFFGALVGTALLFAFLQSPRSSTVLLADAVILVAASAFWSPYVAIGLAILLTLELSMNHRGVMRFREEHCASLLYAPALLAYTLAVALSVFVWLYYTAATPLSNPRFLLGPANLGAWLLTYVLNYAPFLLGLIFVWVPQAWESSQQPFSEGHSFRRRLFWRLAAGLATSAALLSLSNGAYNDWGMRTTLPLSIMLTITVTQLILSPLLKHWYRLLLLGVLVLSTGSALNEFAQAILLDRNCAPYGFYRLENLGQLASQYQGRRNSILYSYFVRWR